MGAGIAGLVAARELTAAGVDVVVLEGRGRVGGRLVSSESGLDLGATWFWPGEKHVTALVSELGIATHQQHVEGDAVYHERGGSRRMDGNPIDVPSFRISDGAADLARRLHEDLPDDTVLLECPAAEVRLDRDRVHVVTDRGTFSARHVVLAMPPALAVSRIRFTPGLPDRLASLAAATPVWMGAVVKVVARYERPFWREAGLSGSAISHHGPMREIHDMSGPEGSPAALFGFVPMTSGGRRPAPAPSELLGQFGELFGSGAARPLELLIHDWRDESFTSPPGVELLVEYRTFGHEVYQSPAAGGRISWASTETAPISPGHIEGAIAAAKRASAGVVAAR